MNRLNRRILADLQSRLETLRTEAEEIAEEIRTLADAEQDKFDNLTEGLQASERGQALEEAAGVLAEAAEAAEAGNVGEALDALDRMPF